MTKPGRMTMAKRPAVILLSGGLDSATVLAIARQRDFACHALSFDYGQRHGVELAAAGAVAQHLGVASHRNAKIDLRAFGGSALTDDHLPVPKDQYQAELSPSTKPHAQRSEASDFGSQHHIPITYVPARNTIFLSYALALAEVLEATDIFIGVNAVDYSGYPDCRPQYIAAFEQMANLATRAGVEGHRLTVHTPLIDLPKPEIIRRGLDLGVDYALTHSCYDPIRDATHRLGHRACGHCDACLIRQHAFAELGRDDPALA
jgi:7-cyano-7-deazaguanine synthase